MSNTITLKKSGVAGNAPASGDLSLGEIALNYADGHLYYKSGASATPAKINAGDADTVDGFHLNQNVLTTSTPTFDKLRLTNGSDASLTSTDHAFQVGASSGQNLVIDNNEIVSRSNGTASTLYLQNDGGDVRLGSNGGTTRLFLQDGSAGAPAITFNNDANTGIYRSAADVLKIVTGGTTRATFNNTGIVSSLNLYSSSGGEFRNYGGTWQGTTGLTGNGFQFVNSVDGTALTISSTGDTVASGSITATSLDINGEANISDHLVVKGTSSSPLSSLFAGSLVVQGAGNEDSIIAVTDVNTTNAAAGVFHQSSTSPGFPALVINAASNGSEQPLISARTNVSNTSGIGGTEVFAVDGDGDATFAGDIVASGTMLVNGAEDNSGKADFAVSGGTVLSFRNNQVQMGGSDMNWNSKIFDDGQARWAAWDRNIEIFSTGSNTGSATARDIIFSPQTSGSAASTERMRIKGSGNVGIGTSSPSSKLHVNDTSVPSSGDLITSKIYSSGNVAANSNTRTGLDVETIRGGWFNSDSTSGNFKISSNNRIGDSDLIGVKSLATVDVNNVYSGVAAGGSLTAFYGKVSTTHTTGSGPVATAYGLRIDAPEVATDSEIGTYYGAYIDGASVSGTLTNKYALVTEASAGNVGIGTTSPAYRLHVSGAVGLTSSLYFTNNTAGIQVGGSWGNGVLNFRNGATNAITFDVPNNRIKNNLGKYLTASSGTGQFGTLDNQSVAIVANNSTKMTILSGGNVGIGITNPIADLHVNGDVQIGSSVSPNAYGALQVNQTSNVDEEGIAILSASAGRSMRIWVDETKSYINSGNGGSGDLILNEGAGKVGIGTASPGYKLEIADDTDSTVNLLRLRNSDAGYSQSWDFQLDTSKDLVITGGSGSGGVHIVPGTRGLKVSGNIVTTSASNVIASRKFSALNTSGVMLTDSAGSNGLSIANGGDATFTHDLIVSGDLTVNGTTSTINSTTLQVDDKNIELGTVATPTDTTADGGGITLKGATDKTINWYNATDAWTFSDRVSVTADESVFGGSGGIPLYVRSTGTVSYVQIQNSSTGSSGTNDGLTVGCNGTAGYLWLREAANLNIGTNDTTAITISSSQNTTFAGNIHLDDDSSQLQFGDDNDMQIYHNGANGEINNSTGGFTIDSAADITLDAGGQDIILSDDGTIFGTLSNSSGLQIRSRVNNADMYLRGVDGGTEFTALRLDMSAGGVATFSSNVIVNGGQILTPSGTNLGLNPNTGIVSVGGVIQCSGTGASTFAGDLTVSGEVEFSALNSASASPFVVSDGGTLGTRTAAEVLDDIGGRATKKISGDGSATTFTVTHSFGTPHVMTQLLHYGNNGTGATYEVVQATVKRNSDNAIDVVFGTAPTSSEDYLVLITKMPAIS